MKITKADREALRKDLASKGYPPADIALAMTARFGVRPRLAFRWAHGTTLEDVAAEWNQQDASGRAPMTGSRVSDYERWPDGGKRPTTYVLLMLAKIYGTTPARLLDDRDYASFNEKQAFEALELCRSNAYETKPPPQETAVTPPVSEEEPAKQQPSRRKVVQALGAFTGAVVTGDHLESIELVRQAETSNVGPQTLEQLDRTVERLGLEFLRTPHERTLEEARAVRQYVAQLLGGKQTLAQKARLYDVAGWLSGLLGHLAFDLGQDSAVHCATALHLAEEVGDAELAAWVRGTQALVAIYDGHPDEAVQFAQAGRQVAPAGSASGVRLWGLEARAYGQKREREPAERAMAAAERGFDGLSQPPNGSIFSFDRPFLLYYAGTAYVGLRQPKRAQECAEQAIALCDAAPADWPVTRVQARITLAHALGQQGQPDGAGKLGVEALHICPAGQRDVPVAARFTELLKALRPNHSVPAVRDLEEQFHAVFAASSSPWI
ncbi:MAG: helix-turn-helix domain-containing protein [Egibacteraceae bacterium]